MIYLTPEKRRKREGKPRPRSANPGRDPQDRIGAQATTTPRSASPSHHHAEAQATTTPRSQPQANPPPRRRFQPQTEAQARFVLRSQANQPPRRRFQPKPKPNPFLASAENEESTERRDVLQPKTKSTERRESTE
jgi:hypothetical protein